MDLSTNRSRRRIRFSLSTRTFAIVVLIVGAWLGWRMRQAREQRAAVAQIFWNGGRVLYDYQYRNGKTINGGKPWLPKAAYNLAGEDFFHDVTTVSYLTGGYDVDGKQKTIRELLEPLRLLTGPERLVLWASPAVREMDELVQLRNLHGLWIVDYRAGDEGAAYISRMPALKNLRLSPTPGLGEVLTHRGIADLAKLTGLESLDLGRYVVGNEDWMSLKDLTSLRELSVDAEPGSLAALKEFPRLRSLSLNDTELTAADMTIITSLPNLEEFEWLKPMSDDEVRSIAQHRGLRRLSLGASYISGRGLGELRNLPRLRELSLVGALRLNDSELSEVATLSDLTTLEITFADKITDAALVHIGRMKNLEALSLARSRNISDAGLVHLQALTRLKRLDVLDTAVTANGVAQLQKALPLVEIEQ